MAQLPIEKTVTCTSDIWNVTCVLDPAMGDHKSHFVFALDLLCKCMRNKSRLAAILFICRANLPCFDARIWRYFRVKTHNSPVLTTQIAGPFYSCGSVTRPMNGSEAVGDLVLIQTSLLFLCKCRLVSITTTRFT